MMLCHPVAALRERREGVVQLRISLDARGLVTQADVTSSSGSPDLDEAAVRAAWLWRFAPANVGGAPQPSTVRQTVRFVLHR